jgi:hypothetical protein
MCVARMPTVFPLRSAIAASFLPGLVLVREPDRLIPATPAA